MLRNILYCGLGIVGLAVIVILLPLRPDTQIERGFVVDLGELPNSRRKVILSLVGERHFGVDFEIYRTADYSNDEFAVRIVGGFDEDVVSNLRLMPLPTGSPLALELHTKLPRQWRDGKQITAGQFWASENRLNEEEGDLFVVWHPDATEYFVLYYYNF